jgi:hypothetical protein
MKIHVDVWLRGNNHATTQVIEGIAREPAEWTDDDVRGVLEGMLRAMHREKNPRSVAPSVSLRGLSWIVNPYEDGGVVIALEIGMGAAIAGPFAIDKDLLEKMIRRVLALPPRVSETVH